MKPPAYDECYLDMMYQKTRFLFKLMARNKMDVFEGISNYMMGDYRRYMDMGNPLYLNKTPKQILGEMGYIPDIDAEISWDYDELILEWMADVYVYLQWKYGIASAEIVQKIPPAELYQRYYPLHETSVLNGCSKLIEIYEIG